MKKCKPPKLDRLRAALERERLSLEAQQENVENVRLLLACKDCASEHAIRCIDAWFPADAEVYDPGEILSGRSYPTDFVNALEMTLAEVERERDASRDNILTLQREIQRQSAQGALFRGTEP